MEIVEELSNARLREQAVDVMVQLEKGTGTRPVLWMLVQARQRAAKAIDMFVDVDPSDVEAVKKIHRELVLYNDVVRLAQETIQRGKEADAMIGEEDRDALDEIVANMSPEERKLYNFEPKQKD